MKNILIIFLMIISVQIFGQKHEIGIDLFTPYDEFVRRTPQNWATLRMNYKNHKEKLTSRYTFELSYTGNLSATVFDTIVNRSGTGDIFYYINHARQTSKIGLFYGLEKNISISKLEFFFGADVGLRFYRVFSGPRWRPQTGTDYGGAEQFPEDKKTADFEIGLIPFAGLRYPITKQLYFNLEFGAELNYIFEDRPYYNGTAWENAGKNYFYIPSMENFFINNIGFSYRF